MKHLTLYLEVSKSFTVTRIIIQKYMYNYYLKMLQLICNLSNKPRTAFRTCFTAGSDVQPAAAVTCFHTAPMARMAPP
jgi:hypothetical protein